MMCEVFDALSTEPGHTGSGLTPGGSHPGKGGSEAVLDRGHYHSVQPSRKMLPRTGN